MIYRVGPISFTVQTIDYSPNCKKVHHWNDYLRIAVVTKSMSHGEYTLKDYLSFHIHKSKLQKVKLCIKLKQGWNNPAKYYGGPYYAYVGILKPLKTLLYMYECVEEIISIFDGHRGKVNRYKSE